MINLELSDQIPTEEFRSIINAIKPVIDFRLVKNRLSVTSDAMSHEFVFTMTNQSGDEIQSRVANQTSFSPRQLEYVLRSLVLYTADQLDESDSNPINDYKKLVKDQYRYLNMETQEEDYMHAAALVTGYDLLLPDNPVDSLDRSEDSVSASTVKHIFGNILVRTAAPLFRNSGDFTTEDLDQYAQRFGSVMNFIEFFSLAWGETKDHNPQVRMRNIDQLVKNIGLLYGFPVEVINSLPEDATEGFVTVVDLLEMCINSMKVMRKGDKSSKVRVLLEQKNDIRSYAVQDAGPGIPEKDVEEIFKKGVSGTGSTGKGLALLFSNANTPATAGSIELYSATRDEPPYAIAIDASNESGVLVPAIRQTRLSEDEILKRVIFSEKQTTGTTFILRKTARPSLS